MLEIHNLHDTVGDTEIPEARVREGLFQLIAHTENWGEVPADFGRK